MKTTPCRECGRTLMGEICMTCCSDVVLANSTRELDRLRAENARLRRFVADQGQTCWPCEKCGHATSGHCLHCEVERLNKLLEKGRVRDVYDLSDMDDAALADLERIRREGGAKLTTEGEPQRRRDAEEGR